MSQTTYKQAGVDLDVSAKAKESIKTLARATHTPNVLKEIGLFSGFYALDLQAYKRPILVSSIDGVGTKVEIAKMMEVYNTIGQDLVNHCVNDIMVCGADPLYFMDYLAADALDAKVVAEIVEGIATACKEANCALIGGETAEMPGIYAQNCFDVAGSIAGIVEHDKIIDGSQIRAGDSVLGVASNGLHTNGYSLIRKVFFQDHDYSVTKYLPETQSTLGEELLRTHRSYLRLIKSIRDSNGLHGIAHVTGGGIIGNTMRLLKDDLTLEIDWSSWEVSPIFKLVQALSDIADEEMRSVFNLGIGLILIVDANMTDAFLVECKDVGESAFVIGSVIKK